MNEEYQETVLPVEESEPADDMSNETDDSEDSSPPFHSFLKFKEQTDEKEIEESDGTENFEDALDDKAVGSSIEKKMERSLVDNIIELPSVFPTATQPPTALPTTWTRMVSSVLMVDSDLFSVRIQGVEQEMLVRLAGVRLAEPWSVEIKKI